MTTKQEHLKNVDVYFGLRGSLTTFKIMLDAHDADFLNVPHHSINAYLAKIHELLKDAYEQYELGLSKQK
jgi:hypothetical protein